MSANPFSGVRSLRLEDQLPACKVQIGGDLYDLREVCRGKNVVDIGCGQGRNRALVEAVGGTWTGVEPFEGGAHTVMADARNLPFADATYDVAIMDAVLEHIPQVEKAFAEVGRVLKPGGVFVGYSAYMECFHEISYSHLSWKALEDYSSANGMRLEKLLGGVRFGMDYHFTALVYPIPLEPLRGLMAWGIRSAFFCKSWLATWARFLTGRMNFAEARLRGRMYYELECLRQSAGFSFLIRKL